MRRSLVLLAVLFLSGSTSTVHAQDRITQDTFLLEIGGWLVNFDTRARLDSERIGRGTDIDFEKDMNLDDDKSVVRLEGTWRFLPRHRLHFGYMEAERNSAYDLTQPVRWGDYTFDTGVQASLNTEVKQYRLAYLWSFHRSDRAEAGVLLGVTYMEFSARLEGAGDVYLHSNAGVGGSWIGSGELEGAVEAPVPTIGLFWDYSFAESWRVRSRIGYFQADIGSIDGNILEGRVTLDWLFSDHAGFGLGYDYSDIEVEDQTGKIRYRVDWQTDGVLAYFSIRF